MSSHRRSASGATAAEGELRRNKRHKRAVLNELNRLMALIHSWTDTFLLLDILATTQNGD